jgi:hypothetical protein
MVHDYATSYATLLLHKERGNSRFHNELFYDKTYKTYIDVDITLMRTLGVCLAFSPMSQAVISCSFVKTSSGYLLWYMPRLFL